MIAHSPSPGRRSMLAMLLAASACLPGCGREVVPPASSKPPGLPVILISLDTVRADALASSGSHGVSVTPGLDRLLADSVEFGTAVSEIPFTLPAHMALLTGAAPDVHGVFGEEDRLAAGLTTLAETLTAAGYATAGVVSSDWLRPGFGFDRGFGSYEEIEHGLEFASSVNRAAFDALDGILREGRPPFLFVHYYDAHSDASLEGNRRPYWAPDRFSTALGERCLEGSCSPEGECATGFLLWASHHADEVDEATRSCLREGYRAGVRALDEGVGELLAGLEARGLYEPALIVLTSDHGEEFGEHGQFVHAQTYHESVAVPLAIKLPGSRGGGRRESRTAQLADLAPTILGILGLPSPPGVTGSDLLAAGESDGDPPNAVALSQNKHRPERYALLWGRWKLVHDYVTGRTRLYDRDRDPAEISDVAGERPEVVADLMSRLEERRRGYRRLRLSLVGGSEPENPQDEARDGALDSNARRRLEALGYLN